MATQAQIDANRANAQKSTGPKSETGKARSCMNRLSHGFASSFIHIGDHEREEFNALRADLHQEFQPATMSEQMLLEKMILHHWNSRRAYITQQAFIAATQEKGSLHPDFALVMRYYQSSERLFLKFRTELLNAQKERKKSEIGFESQEPVDPPQLPAPTLPKPSTMDELEKEMGASVEELAKLMDLPVEKVREMAADILGANQKAA